MVTYARTATTSQAQGAPAPQVAAPKPTSNMDTQSRMSEQTGTGAAPVPQAGETNDETWKPAPSRGEVEKGAKIELGMQGPLVSEVQTLLNRLGLGVAATGQYGPTTQSMVQRFQQIYKVQSNGLVGPTTLSTLDRAIKCSIELADFLKMAPGVGEATARQYLPYLNASMLQANISTDARKAAYIAQLGHESDGFNTFEEYASGAEYEGREDLGNVNPGDGQRYKGRGAIQITGRHNYQRYGKMIGVDLEQNPELAQQTENAFAVSAAYWTDHDLNELVDQGDFWSVTQVINGGQRGASDRNYRHSLAKNVLAQRAKTGPTPIPQAQPTTGPAPTGGTGSGEGSAQPTPDQTDTVAQDISPVVETILGGNLQDAQNQAHTLADGLRAAAGGQDTPSSKAAGEAWWIARSLGTAQASLKAKDGKQAKNSAHDAAERARGMQARRHLGDDQARRIILAAQGWWNQANQFSSPQQGGATSGAEGRTDRGRYAVWTTGGAYHGGSVTSQELEANGDWSSKDFLKHHSDRSGSWAADNIRNNKNQDLQAYDFTFEKTDGQGNAIAGTAQGLELIVPSDMKVIDIQKTYANSGGYGCFIALEDVETGLRVEIHHLDSVGDFSVGQLLDGGTVFGKQGGSGNQRNSYATHVDIVGTAAAVEAFVRANQSGVFRTNKTSDNP